MKNRIFYLIVAFLLFLSVIAHFYPTPKIESLETYQDDKFWKHESDSLRATISSLKRKNEAIITNLLLQQKRYIQKIQEIQALPADSQLLVFKNYTGCTENTSLKVTPSDTIAEIPVKNIRDANLKFVELEASNLQNQMLETKSATQDSIISTYEHVCADLTRYNELLLNGIRQKDNELKKQKAKHRLELIGAGALIALIIIF